MADEAKDVGQESVQAALQAAEQATQQAAQASQRAEQAMASAQQAARAVGGESSSAALGSTIETDISPVSIGDAWRANIKRSYDEYQDLGLTRARNAEDHANRMRTIAENTFLQLQEHQADLRAQKVRHNDLAVDRQWNVDEVARLVTNSATFQDAVAAGVIASLNTQAKTAA